MSSYHRTSRSDRNALSVLLLGVALVLMGMACAPTVPRTSAASNEKKYPAVVKVVETNYTVIEVVDVEPGVRCYNRSSAAISCLRVNP